MPIGEVGAAALVKEVWNQKEFQELAVEKGLKLFYIDIDKHQDLMEEYEVSSIPTWFLLEEDSGKSGELNGKESLENVLLKINEFFVEKIATDSH